MIGCDRGIAAVLVVAETAATTIAVINLPIECLSEDADRLDALSSFRQTGESLIHRCAGSLKCLFAE
jgi:hypothetical protein